MRWFTLAIVLIGPAALWAADGVLPGSGTEADPYLIEDFDDFEVFADSVDSATYWAGGVYTRLECDIDLDPALDARQTYTNAVIASDTPDTSENFDGVPFEGIFDGNGHVIRNLTIDTAGAHNSILGLFGIILLGGEIRSLGVENVSIVGGDESECFGGVCAFNFSGLIDNCYATGSVSGGVGSGKLGVLCGATVEGIITDCYAVGSVSGGADSHSLGGLCGHIFHGEIIGNCHASGSVTGGEGSEYIGGLCGLGQAILVNCYATGSVAGGDNSGYVGGLCGIGSISINNCYATGSVTGGDNSEYLGGLCASNSYSGISNCYATGTVTGGINSAFLGGLCARNEYGCIINCYSTGLVSGVSGRGGLCGVNDFGIIGNCYFLETAGPDNGYGEPLTASQMKQQSSFVDWDFAGETANGTSDLWIINSGEYPRLIYSDPSFIPYEFVGHGTVEEPYLIHNADDLGAIWQQHDRCYRLCSDIDLSGISWSIAVVPIFNGVFDGNGHVVSNIEITGGRYLGLFGCLFEGAAVTNLGVENVDITGWHNAMYLGGLCGTNGGAINNCYATGEITSDYDSHYLGGLSGSNGETICNCYTAVQITSGIDSGSLGGLCGHNNCGEITITNCYATGSVNARAGSEAFGGLCGFNLSGTFGNCFWDIETSGMTKGTGNDDPDPVGVTGRTRIQMQTQSMFTDAGWDFMGEDINGSDDVWRMCADGVGYPRLTWQFLAGDFICPDGVTMTDFAVLAETWGLSSDQAGYNNVCDLTDDDMIDVNDLTAFAENWLGDYNEGDGSAENPFRIGTAAQLDGIKDRSEDWDKHFILTANINMAGYSYSTAVIASEGCFTGVFDGDGHVIRNLTIDTDGVSNDYLGLFGCIEGAEAEVRNLGMQNVNITGGSYSEYVGGVCGKNSGTIADCYATGSMNGRYDLGGLCGRNSGTIINCYAGGSVNGRSNLGGLCGFNSRGAISDCHADSEVIGRNQLGGLCGYNYEGTISRCYADGSVEGSYTCGGLCGINSGGVGLSGGDIIDCYAVGSVSGGNDCRNFGGLCGINYGKINSSYATGSVTGAKWARYHGGLCGISENGTVSDCYATGSVIAGEFAHDLGGLCGLNQYSTITNCYATGSAGGDAGSYDTGGFCGVSLGDTISGCFWDMQASGMTDGIGNEDPDSAGVVGKTTAEMQTRSTFTDAGWDFVGESANGTEDLWDIGEGTSYPNLVW
ncbi:MAG: hypothetical protein JXA82_11720 [Sedimentisphaerales bacterium]|nr:hypothetical protein [Sedimentisphaerales bacterium]